MPRGHRTHIGDRVTRLSASPGCDLRGNQRFLPSDHHCQWNTDHARYFFPGTLHKEIGKRSALWIWRSISGFTGIPPLILSEHTDQASHVYRQNARVLWASHYKLLPFINEHATEQLCFHTFLLLFKNEQIFLHVIKDGYDRLFVTSFLRPFPRKRGVFTYVRGNRTYLLSSKTVPSEE